MVPETLHPMSVLVIKHEFEFVRKISSLKPCLRLTSSFQQQSHYMGLSDGFDRYVRGDEMFEFWDGTLLCL